MIMYHMSLFTKENIIKLKRMFHSIENEVLELKRIKIAQLELDHNLDLGSYRLLTQIDFDNLKN